jgi:serine/threonine protein kinase
MRAIFMIPTKPSPSFKDESKCSSQIMDFVLKCLFKNTSNRSTASELLNHDFLKLNIDKKSSLENLIEEINQAKSVQTNSNQTKSSESTMYSTATASSSNSLFYTGGEIVSDTQEFKTLVVKSTLNSSDGDYNETMKTNFTTLNSIDSSKLNKIEEKDDEIEEGTMNNTMIVNNDDDENQDVYLTAICHKDDEKQDNGLNTEANQIRNSIRKEIRHFDNDCSFLANLNPNDIMKRLKYLDEQMEKDIQDLKQKYANKRAIIEQAIEFKKKNSTIF